jgi:hypothetical protein
MAENKPLQLTFYEDSPDAGPNCPCSLCGKPIMENVIRMWDTDTNLEGRFHQDCFNKVYPTGPQVTRIELHIGKTEQ